MKPHNKKKNKNKNSPFVSLNLSLVVKDSGHPSTCATGNHSSPHSIVGCTSYAQDKEGEVPMESKKTAGSTVVDRASAIEMHISATVGKVLL